MDQAVEIFVHTADVKDHSQNESTPTDQDFSPNRDSSTSRLAHAQKINLFVSDSLRTLESFDRDFTSADHETQQAVIEQRRQAVEALCNRLNKREHFPPIKIELVDNPSNAPTAPGTITGAYRKGVITVKTSDLLKGQDMDQSLFTEILYRALIDHEQDTS